MRARHLVYLVVLVAAAAVALGSCSLLGFVSISERISDFQASLNNTDRSNAYQNFHPDKCSDYNSLKNPAFVINPTFPTANISYSLSITDQSNSSAVLVTVTGNGFATLYLTLDMETTGLGDNRIVTMGTSSTGASGSYTTVIQ